MMHCLTTFLWQPYNTLLPEEGDDPTIIKDKIDTLDGCRSNYQTRSYGYSLLSPCCIFGALVIISALGLSGILPGATTGWIMAGLGGSVIAANILMGNIKNRLACVSNYTMIGAIILGVGLAGAFGALSGMTVGIAVLSTWLIGNCFGCYFYYANPFAQRFFNEVTILKLVGKTKKDLEIKRQMMQVILKMDSPNFSLSSELEKLRQLQQEISPSSSLSSELEKMIRMLEGLQDMYPSSSPDSNSSDSSDDEGDDELSQVMRMIAIRDLQKDIDSPSSSDSSELEKKKQMLQYLMLNMNSGRYSDSSSSDSSDDERWVKLPQELKVRLLMRQLQKDIDSPSSSDSSELEKKKKMLQYLLNMNSGRYPDSSSSDSSSSDSISSDSSDSDD